MSRNEDRPTRPLLNTLHFGELPRTRFVDWLDAIQVKLINGPDRATIGHALRLMKQATWATAVEQIWARVEAEEATLADNHPLPIFLEIPAFTFEVSGISRIITHQIVRTRLGVTYSQKGTGESDLRHDDVMVPRSLNRPGQEYLLEAYCDRAIGDKMLYAQMLDEVDDEGKRVHSLVAARYVLPQNTSQFIYVNISLLALMGLVGKRLCTYETQEYNRVARLMVSEMETHWPEFAGLLKADCDRPGGCTYMRAKDSSVAGSMYVPDKKHDVYEWNPKDFVYDRTRDEMLAGPAFVEREYVGWVRIR